MKSDVPPENAKDDNARESMQAIGSSVYELLPTGWGFFVLCFQFGDAPGRMNFVSNANRENVLAVMKEFLLKSGKSTAGTHAEDSELMVALVESVKLQSHYAKLLNQHDGGERMQFENVAEWIERLRKVGTLPEVDV